MNHRELIWSAYSVHKRILTIKKHPENDCNNIILKNETRMFSERLKMLGWTEEQFTIHIKENHEYFLDIDMRDEFMKQCRIFLKHILKQNHEDLNKFTSPSCMSKFKCDPLCKKYDKATEEEICEYDLGGDPFK